MKKRNTRNRILGIFLASVVMLTTLMPAFSIEANAATKTYSVDDALTYAAANWDSGVGLCAEFVSRCVMAGGLEGMNVQAGTGGCWSKLENLTGLKRTQLKVDSKGYATRELDGNILAAGDVVVIYCQTHSIAPHIIICAGYDAQGYAIYYAHNNALNRGRYRLNLNLSYQHTTSCDMGGQVIRLSTLDSSAGEVYYFSFADSELESSEGSAPSPIYVSEGNKLVMPSTTFTHSSYIQDGWLVKRQNANNIWEYYVEGQGWFSQESMDQYGYHAKVYLGGKSYTIGSTWGDNTPGNVFVFEPNWANAEVIDLSLSNESLTLTTESSYTIDAMVASVGEYDAPSIKWTSSNPSVASVNASGVVTAKSYGTATISAACGGITKTCEVTSIYKDAYPGLVNGTDTITDNIYSAINWMADSGYTKGLDGKNVEFGSFLNCNRKDFVIFLWRAAGKPAAGTAKKFSDVNAAAGTDTYKAITWATSSGIINGYSDGTFRPTDSVTRGQVAIMLWKYSGRPEITQENGFTDVSVDPETGLTENMAKAISWCEEEGIVRGYDDGTFKPLDFCQRFQMAIVLHRLLIA